MIKVNCFCSGITFPYGEATNNRIIMVGKALLSAEVDFEVYINSEGNRNKLNDKLAGEFDGIQYRHLNGSMAIGLSIIKRILNFCLFGFINTFKTIRFLAKSDENVIYLYSHGTIFNLWVSLLGKIYKIPVVQEVNEWTEAVEEDFIQSFIYKKIMFRWAKGAIVISNNIVEQINKYKGNNNKLKTILLPILADKSDWSHKVSKVNKTFVWCGLIEGYFKDVVFLIESFALLHAKHPSYKLLICGKYKPETKIKITTLLASLDINPDSVELTGFISNEELISTCQTATALIAPLWDDQRSKARFPTKVASFLFSERPVLTCDIGEVGSFLSDQKTALFFKPGDEKMLMNLMESIITDPKLANTIGQNGKELAMQRFDNESYSVVLKEFFS